MDKLIELTTLRDVYKIRTMVFELDLYICLKVFGFIITKIA